MSYFALVLITVVIGFGAQWYIKHAYKKWSKYGTGYALTGAQAARRMLDDHGLTNVPVRCVSGTLSDHYDPRSRTVSLSQDIYNSTSISAVAVACHECGHAVQHASGYAPMSIRSAMVPVVNIGSSAWMILLIIGIALNWMGLCLVAIAIYGLAVLFQLVTLPVEFNASRRGMSYITDVLCLPHNVSSGCRKVLTAAALTYVAAALTSIIQLLYYLSIFRD